MADKNLDDDDIEPAPKLVEVLFQNCKGQVDHWVEPYLRITVERLRLTEKASVKCCLIKVVADALYYNASLSLSILHKLGVAAEVFNLWFQMLMEVRKSGMRANFKRENDKKVCCLGLTSLLAVPAGQLPDDALGRVFRATLELLIAYKDQVAEAEKEDADEEDDNMDGLPTDDDDDDDGSDQDMGLDSEDGDEVDSATLKRLAAQAKASRPDEDDEDDDEYSDDDFSDDEELLSPIDDVDPFIFFVDSIKVLQASDPARFDNLSRTLEFQYQALGNGVAQHAEKRRQDIEKKASSSPAANT